MGVVDDEIAREQSYVSRLYARLDELRDLTRRRLAEVRRAGASGTHAMRTERDAFATLYEDRLAQLQAVEDRLAFGRLDLTGGETRYIGRIGLSDDTQEQLLTDWRAPAAEPFYRATAAEPAGVVRRRHLMLRGRAVTSLEDDVLDPDALGDEMVVAGEGALMASLNAARTGRMRDIVATIQAEQDRVIRAPLPGVLVVQGGPGTGKTAVALHRAAYLLYAHRERIARSGVLLVGPNRSFLRYIEQVLPALGETGVVMSTVGELFPGVRARATEPDEVAALKGDLRMVDVVANAVRQRQRVPDAPVPLDVAGTRVVLRPRVVAQARQAARDTHKPHNAARVVFVKRVLADLVRQLATAQRLPVDDDTRPSLEADLRASPDVRREVNLCWMPLTATGLLESLYASPQRLAAAAPHLTAGERALLYRERGSGWTPADVPLLDEIAELIGDDDEAARAASDRAAARRREELEYARGVLELSGTGGFVGAETLLDRYAHAGPSLTLAERAESDRTWAYGHLVVDEAQELSAMAWRVLLRRCPSRSMTVVGDVAQTGSAAGTASWAQVLDPLAEGRWRIERLTVNYRTPRQVMDLATAVVGAAGLDVDVPGSAREGATDPVARRISGPGDVPEVVADELDELDAGLVAVITPDALAEEVVRLLVAKLGDDVVRAADDDTEAPVTVTTVRQVKGLEFDVVVLVEPAAVVEQSPRGVNDLYVALTRPTQRLVVLHSGELPPGLHPLA
ncbi:MAG: HelD family protein [Actinomycetota bacterium]